MPYESGLPQIEGANPRRGGCIALAIVAAAILFGARFFASLVIDYQWWKEMGQVETWVNIWLYNYAPITAATLAAFTVLWIAHVTALKQAGVGLGRYPLYTRLSAVALLLVSWMIAAGTMDSWAVVKYFGGRTLARGAAQWHDPVFNQPLGFYLFDVPMYSVLLSLVLALVAAAVILHFAALRFWQLRSTVRDWSQVQHIDIGHFSLSGILESGFVRLLSALFLAELAARFYLGRYQMLLERARIHGRHRLRQPVLRAAAAMGC